MKRCYLLIALFVLSTLVGHTQNNDVTGIPFSFSHPNISYSIDKIDLPHVDVSSLMAEDAENVKNGEPLRIGAVHKVGLNFDNCGRTDILPDGAKLWRVALHSENAYSMAVSFTQFNIPEGASFYIYNNDRSEIAGTYSNSDIQPNGILQTDYIAGDEIVLEYYEPADVRFHGSMEISRVGHIYRDIFSATDGSKGNVDDAQDCHFHAVCPQGREWHDQINSVVHITITAVDGTYSCSGALINNVRMDKTPYILSANHCLKGLDCGFSFLFFYQRLRCDGSGIPPLKKMAGGEIKAYVSENTNAGINTSSDFLLLKLTRDLASKPWSDSLYFAGWDATGASSVGLAVHHPAGAYKRFSFPKTVTTYSFNTRYWNVSWYTNPSKGCTEQGSSGSPLFNQNKLIIGDLSNGSSACDYNGTDNYGKLSYSWTNNNNSDNSKKLKPWLDPDNTGRLTLPGMSFDGTVDVTTYTSNTQFFNVAPNPSTGVVTIQGNFEDVEGQCLVYNATGQLVSTFNVQLSPSFTVNFNQLPNGIYFLEINGNEQVYRSKMIIAK